MMHYRKIIAMQNAIIINALSLHPNARRHIAARAMQPSLFHGVYKVATDMQIAIRHSRNALHVPASHTHKRVHYVLRWDAKDNILQ